MTTVASSRSVAVHCRVLRLEDPVHAVVENRVIKLGLLCQFVGLVGNVAEQSLNLLWGGVDGIHEDSIFWTHDGSNANQISFVTDHVVQLVISILSSGWCERLASQRI